MDRYIVITLFVLITILSITPPIHAQTSYRVYAFVSTNSPIYLPGQKLVAEIYIYPSVPEEKQATIKLYFTNLPNAPSIPDITLTIPSSNEKKFLMISSQPVTIPDVDDGTYYLKMEIWVNGQKIAEDTVDFWIRHGPPSGIEPIILFVWHNHQAPNYYPDGTFFSRWHIDHFFQDGLKPYFTLDMAYNTSIYPDMGTYYLHYYLLTKYPHVKANLHYSPSLIYQLNYAATHGFKIFDQRTGRFKTVSPNDTLAQVIRDFFKGLRELHEEGRVYIVTSCFAHTIMGYYMDKYDVDKLIKYDISLGMNWTSKLIISTDAIWTPEMAWSDKLTPIYLDLGIKYTVLDGTHHFPGAQGDKGTIFEPYIVKDQTGRELIVFFRDQVISDGDIGFTNNDWDEPRQADRDARKFYYDIYNIHSFKNYKYPPIEVVAADGENWMLFAPSTANGALFLDRLYRYMESLTLQGIMRSGTFEDAVKAHPPQRVLTYIPSTSWLGSWGKWTTEKGEEHREAWEKMDNAMAMYKGLLYYKDINTYTQFMHEIITDKWFNESIVALIHAMDSDFWWAEFFSMSYINRWLEAFDDYMSKLFNIKIVVTTEPKYPVTNVENKVYVTIYNNNDYVMRDTSIYVGIKGYGSTVKKVDINPGSPYTIELSFNPGSTGKASVIVRLYNPATIISGKTYYIVDKQYGLTIYESADLSVKTIANAPNNAVAGLQPTPPGEYSFTVIVYNVEKKSTGYDIPVEVTLVIGGKNYTKEATIDRDEYSTTIIFKVSLEEGDYPYKVIVSSPYDPDTDNNVFRGEIIVSASATTPSTTNATMYLLYAVIGLWAVVAILLVVKIILRKKK